MDLFDFKKQWPGGSPKELHGLRQRLDLLAAFAGRIRGQLKGDSQTYGLESLVELVMFIEDVGEKCKEIEISMQRLELLRV